MIDQNFADFIRLAPKADLHQHLGGSIRLSTILDLAERNRIKLPYQTIDGLQQNVFKRQYDSLAEYLECFKYTSLVSQTGEALTRIGYESVVDNYADGVTHLELRFAPHLHVSHKDGVIDAIKSVYEGMKLAADEINASNPKIPFNFGIICIAMRHVTPESSPYFHRLGTTLTLQEASLNLVHTATYLKSRKLYNVVGFDLAGPENTFPAKTHAKAFRHAFESFLGTTVHAGEAYGPESIYQAITDLCTTRIGHGTNLLRTDMIKKFSKQEDKQSYVDGLVETLSNRRIPIEICLTSNMMVNPVMWDNPTTHPMKNFMDKGLACVLATDNRTVCNTTLSKEFMLAKETFNLSLQDVKKLVIRGFKHGFYAEPYVEKRDYVRKVIDVYEDLELKYFGVVSPRY